MLEKDTPSVPQGPSRQLDPLASTGPAMQLCVSNLKTLFAEKPISTRRAIFNMYLDRYGPGSSDSAKDNWRPILRFALPYVCYMFKSGPYRDAYVLFGIDPRKESKWAKYQTAIFYFRSGHKPKQWESQNNVERLWRERRNHVFTGKEVGCQVGSFLFEDILDPMLRRIIDESSLRDKFHVFLLCVV